MDGASPTPTRGWNREKTEVFKAEFFRFLKYVRVNSKEMGNIVLGDHVYRAQRLVLDGIFAGLANDIHDFKILKSRQLGVSTISRALTLFWIGVHHGLKGYMVFDTDSHKEEARLELISMIESLPAQVKFPRIKRQNRYLLELANGSMMNFASAGTKAGKAGGVLGRSSGINFYHRSELCSYDNPEGMEAFQNSLAEDFPDRLYIDESTARGFNLWHEIWTEAKKNPRHQHCIFVGFWAKDNQVIETDDPDFLRFGEQAPTEREMKKIIEVRDRYDWSITPQQLAWIRRKMDPSAQVEGDADPEYEGTTLRLQEQPWTEDDAFQMTGAVFFNPEDLTNQATKHTSNKFETFMYGAGIEFVDMRIYKATNARSIELKVWEKPEEEAVYVVAADPAFGHSENNDRSAIQVLRCYADGVDQVAEYAWPLISTRQFAWVILSLAGWYAGDTGAVYLIVELNGPGGAVWDEIVYMRKHLSAGYQPQEVAERGLKDVFRNVRNYMYSRPDSMSAGRAWQWKTSPGSGPTGKTRLMERLRDFTSNGMLHVRSLETLEEMRSITREGDSIEARGRKKDDRAFSLALGVQAWEQRARGLLVSQRRTRANEELKKRLTIRDQIAMFGEHQLQSFFAIKNIQRRRDAMIARRAARRARW